MGSRARAMGGRKRIASWISGRQEQQIHDLRDSGTAHMGELSQIRIVGDRTALNQSFEPNRQGHEPRDAGDASRALAVGDEGAPPWRISFRPPWPRR